MRLSLSRREWLSGSAALAILMGTRASAKATDVDRWDRAKTIEASIRPPVFPTHAVNITDFGARGDGVTLNTEAIARAIETCAASGGGQVVVPQGTFLTGAITLKSNIDLHVEAGATLLFSTDPAHYPNVFTRWEGMELISHSPLIYAYQQSHIAITGKGTIDGQGSNAAWWSWCGAPHYGWVDGMPRQQEARAKLAQMTKDGVPVKDRIFGEGSYLRPPLIQLYLCENILIEGVRLRNSPFWNIHPVMSNNVIVRDVDIFGHGPNNDGCDPESVDHMLIARCTFNTGDDCIAIKSGRNNDGRRLATPSQNIVIRDCVMKDGHGGVVLGSEISGGVQWVFIENCRMDSENLWYALRFKNNAERGGVLEHVYARDIEVGQVSKAVITCDFNYEEGANGPYTPILRDVVVERLVAKRALRVLDSQGLPNAPVRDITFTACRFDGVTQSSVITNTENLRLDKVRVNGKPATKL